MQLAQIGQSVSVLFYVDGKPTALRATVTNVSPFQMTTSDPGAKLLGSNLRAVLIIQKGNEFSKAEALLSVSGAEGQWDLSASEFGWEEVDRRRYNRHNLNLKVSVRGVMETNGTVELKSLECVTEDVSLGGAWLKTSERLESGLLVEFQLETPSHGSVRALSIVRWADTLEKDGFGVEFIDFVGGSRKSLHSLLSKAA